jgi:hypothetical protein
MKVGIERKSWTDFWVLDPSLTRGVPAATSSYTVPEAIVARLVDWIELTAAWMDAEFDRTS